MRTHGPINVHTIDDDLRATLRYNTALVLAESDDFKPLAQRLFMQVAGAVASAQRAHQDGDAASCAAWLLVAEELSTLVSCATLNREALFGPTSLDP